MAAALHAAWADASTRYRRVLLVACGSTDECRAVADMTAELSPPNLDALPDRLISNFLHFRANYTRLLAGWVTVCFVRHPSSALWLICIGAAWFHSLVVRRGVVHLSIPGADAKQQIATLMWPTLHAALAGGSFLILLIIGRIAYVFWLIFPPLTLCLAHAITRAPAVRHSETERQLAELAAALHAAMRGQADDGADIELEAGGEDFDPFGGPPPERNEAMAERVEAIRQKYRPPPSHGGTRRHVD